MRCLQEEEHNSHARMAEGVGRRPVCVPFRDFGVQDVGPCMTVLLQKKIVDNLCALGQADVTLLAGLGVTHLVLLQRPPGMMPLVLDTMQQLLECSRQGLMDHHGQITDPVHKLIRVPSRPCAL